MNTRLLVLALVICSCGTSAPDPTAFTTTLPDGGQCPAGTRICINSSTGTRCTPYWDHTNCGTCGNVCDGVTTSCYSSANPCPPGQPQCPDSPPSTYACRR